MFYIIVSMSDSNGVEVDAPGADTSLKVPDVATIEKWLARDVASCISLLQAINTDFDLRRQIAIFMHGRYSNALSRPQRVDPNQTKLPL